MLQATIETLVFVHFAFVLFAPLLLLRARELGLSLREALLGRDLPLLRLRDQLLRPLRGLLPSVIVRNVSGRRPLGKHREIRTLVLLLSAFSAFFRSFIAVSRCFCSALASLARIFSSFLTSLSVKMPDEDEARETSEAEVFIVDAEQVKSNTNRRARLSTESKWEVSAAAGTNKGALTVLATMHWRLTRRSVAHLGRGHQSRTAAWTHIDLVRHLIWACQQCLSTSMRSLGGGGGHISLMM